MATLTIKNANRTEEHAKRPQKYVVEIFERENRRGTSKNSLPFVSVYFRRPWHYYIITMKINTGRNTFSTPLSRFDRLLRPLINNVNGCGSWLVLWSIHKVYIHTPAYYNILLYPNACVLSLLYEGEKEKKQNWPTWLNKTHKSDRLETKKNVLSAELLLVPLTCSCQYNILI